MQQIFIDNNDIVDDTITITGDDANHLINAVRIKSGEQIRVSTSSEESYLCEVDTTSEGVLVLIRCFRQNCQVGLRFIRPSPRVIEWRQFWRNVLNWVHIELFR